MSTPHYPTLELHLRAHHFNVLTISRANLDTSTAFVAMLERVDSKGMSHYNRESAASVHAALSKLEAKLTSQLATPPRAA